jgi:hypothetical protein
MRVMMMMMMLLERKLHPICSPSVALYMYLRRMMMMMMIVMRSDTESHAYCQVLGLALAIRVIPFLIHVWHHPVTGESVRLWLRQFRRMAWLVLRMLLPQPRARLLVVLL